MFSFFFCPVAITTKLNIGLQQPWRRQVSSSRSQISLKQCWNFQGTWPYFFALIGSTSGKNLEKKNLPLKSNCVAWGEGSEWVFCWKEALSRPGIPDRPCGLEVTIHHSLPWSLTIWIWRLPTAFRYCPCFMGAGGGVGGLTNTQTAWNDLQEVTGGFRVLSPSLTLPWPPLPGSTVPVPSLHPTFPSQVGEG